MSDVELDARLDELFRSDPKHFTTKRDALVRELKTAGHADAAAEVKALRRPTVAVAAVNRVARERPGEVAELVELGADLAALQGDAGADRNQLRDLTRQRRTLLQQLTEHAAATTQRPDNVRAAVTATLDAASLDDSLRDDLQRGRLTQELSPAARFVLGDDLGASPSAPRRPARATRAAPPPRDELAARRAKAELEAARERAEEVEESVREQSAAAADAAERLEAAHRHIADLEAALADARAELVDLKRAERDAQRAERRSRTEQERATAALRAAERAVEETK